MVHELQKANTPPWRAACKIMQISITEDVSEDFSEEQKLCEATHLRRPRLKTRNAMQIMQLKELKYQMYPNVKTC
jgi:hypothetical protein